MEVDIKSYNLEDYNKFPLSKSTVTAQFTDLVEFCLISEDECAKHSLHKVYIHHWSEHPNLLFDVLSEAMSTSLIPLKVCYENNVVSFYTSNLNLIFRIIKSDFTFVYQSTAYNVDSITFNSTTSLKFFGHKYTIEEIIRNNITLRFSKENNELDLSNFCEESYFSEMKIHFYKIHLLAYYKELMLRMGREVKILNLSNNNLSAIPLEIMNFFIKGKLIGLNASNNNIDNLTDVRCHSLIEKLWLEGNPVCRQFKESPYLYVKQAVVKFPRLQWLDDVPVNRFGLIYPFWRFFCQDDNEYSRGLVDKFLIIYFSHYDSISRMSLKDLYHADCMLTIAVSEDMLVPLYSRCGRFLLCARAAAHFGAKSVLDALATLPRTTHDPNSFSVDVIRSDQRIITLIVDGVYKEYQLVPKLERLVQFRRTFVLMAELEGEEVIGYYITNDMLSITCPSKEVADTCFQVPVRNLNSLMLINPGSQEINDITAVFMHYTQLKKQVAITRLMTHDWDLEKALQSFCSHFRLDQIPRCDFKEDDINTDDKDDNNAENDIENVNKDGDNTSDVMTNYADKEEEPTVNGS